MPVEIKMPKWGMMMEARIVQWLKKEEEEVKRVVSETIVKIANKEKYIQ